MSRVATSNYGFKFDDEKIEVVGEYKCLTILFSYNGRFRKGQLERKDHATKARYPLIETS